MREQAMMGMKGLKYFLMSTVVVVSMVTTMKAQDSSIFDDETKARKDSLVRVEKKIDTDNLSDLKAERNETRAKAREAQRVERNATDAARESRIAYRNERKAQKARLKADKQAKKAAKARVVSDNDN